MTLKRPTLFAACAIAAGSLTSISIGIWHGNMLQSESRESNKAEIETAKQCRYMYDEMAHKLVAYSPTDYCTASQAMVSHKLGSRILAITKGTQSETPIITL